MAFNGLHGVKSQKMELLLKMTFTHSSIEGIGIPVALESKLRRVTGQMLGKYFETS
jgi:hypothetical protein